MEIQLEQGRFLIRPVEAHDNEDLKEIIVTSLLEFGASGDGFACNDAETQAMFEAYQPQDRAYFTLLRLDEAQARIVGGAGVCPLPGTEDTCEFVKMYYRPEVRGLGLGKIMLNYCMEVARTLGYSKMYLETLEHMHAARALYEKFGFEKIPGPAGCTGHYSCDTFYSRDL